MKYRLTFECPTPLQLPQQYNKILQAALLNWLNDESYAGFLHHDGYRCEKRIYKLYAFSNIFGNYRINRQDRTITFYDQIQIYLSFYTEESHQLILNNIQDQRPIRFGGDWYALLKCELIQEKMQPCIVKALSPVTVHSTLLSGEGKKKTYYFSPEEKEFFDQIRSNLCRKYVSIYEREPKDTDFFVRLFGRERREVTILYDRFVIRGYMGRFVLDGSHELIRLALLSGLGARNGIGMGFVLQEKTI